MQHNFKVDHSKKKIDEALGISSTMQNILKDIVMEVLAGENSQIHSKILVHSKILIAFIEALPDDTTFEEAIYGAYRLGNMESELNNPLTLIKDILNAPD